MNAPRLATLLVGYALRLRTPPIALALTLALATACSLGQVGNSPTQPKSAPRCADLVAHAFSSPGVPVAGAFACLTPEIQNNFAMQGISDDASFAQYAATPPVFTADRYVGRSTSPVASVVRYYFELTPQRCFEVTVDAHGLVNNGGFASQDGQPCPSPLP